MSIFHIILFLYFLLTRRSHGSHGPYGVYASSNEDHLIYPSTSMNIPKVLVYTYTDGFRHDSIPTAISVLVNAGVRWGMEFDFTENKSIFNDDYLKQYDALMFISVTGDALDGQGEQAFHRYIQSGGNFVGVHASTCALYNSSVYNATIGSQFEWHPVIQDATFVRSNISHPATANVPDQWRFAEEVYYFTFDPRDNGAVVIVTVDESSYNNESYMSNSGEPHPIAWYIDPPSTSQPLQEGTVKAGRSFYTALGHSNETWQNETFINHLLSGLTWALDGASTRAYGVGIVGSENPRPTISSSTDSPTSSPTHPGHALQVTSGVGKVLTLHVTCPRLCFVVGFAMGFVSFSNGVFIMLLIVIMGSIVLL
ncbi:hypothetical protein V865_001713 [Kwoniella europaea PYCC6329]|uniref:ThuA-like domain-containing protein n=1 Tax=Kwoniella europaea PYCC6329 TaxID=1423913 RepID=A0AAX4KCK4_9TREE